MKVILPVVQFTNCTGGDYLRPKAERVRLAQVVLFIDYQNTYRATRACFHDHATDPAQFGQIWPLSIGQVLVNRSPFPRELSEVRVYRGLPSSHRDPKAYGAARRQNAAWTRDPEVHVISRPIRYPPGYPTTHAIGQKPTEKGIDVSLAVDFVTLAVQGKYDIGILMSLDTDLIPALEFVHNLGQANGGYPRAEVAAWSVPGHQSRRLSLQGQPLFCHWLTAADYPVVRDWTTYAGAPPVQSRP